MQFGIIYLGDTPRLPSEGFFRRFKRNFPQVQNLPDDGMVRTLYVLGDMSFPDFLEVIHPLTEGIREKDRELHLMALMIDSGRQETVEEEQWREAYPDIPILTDFQAIAEWLGSSPANTSTPKG